MRLNYLGPILTTALMTMKLTFQTRPIPKRGRRRRDLVGGRGRGKFPMEKKSKDPEM